MTVYSVYESGVSVRRLLSAVLAATLLAGGCGLVDGEKNSSTPPPPPVTGQQLQAAASDAYGADAAAVKALDELSEYKREHCSYEPDSTANNLCSEQGGFSREAKLAEARTTCRNKIKGYDLLASQATKETRGSLPERLTSQVTNPKTGEKLTCATSK